MKNIQINVSEELVESIISNMKVEDLLKDKSARDIINGFIELDTRSGEWDLLNELFKEFLNRVVTGLYSEIESGYGELNAEVLDLLLAYKLVEQIKEGK